MTGNSTMIDPRDDVLGRSRVTDTPELEAFYQELAARNAGAFWKRANAIEPWEPETRYRPTLWRYAEMRAMCLRAPEHIVARVDDSAAFCHHDVSSSGLTGCGSSTNRADARGVRSTVRLKISKRL